MVRIHVFFVGEGKRVNYNLEPGGVTAGGHVGESVDFDGSGGLFVLNGMHGNGGETWNMQKFR